MTDNIPLVSVIMPVYNSEKYLNEAIDSILNQTYKNIELIIIDDGSSDNSVKLIREYKSSKIKFYQNEKNMGVSATRNKAIDLSKGKYIALLDSDDISPLYRIEKEVEFLEKNVDFGLVGGHYQRFKTNKFFTRKKTIKHSLILEENKVRVNFVGSFAASTVMFRTDIVKNNNLYFDSSLKMAEDFDLWRRISFFSKVTNLNELLLYYRLHPSSAMKRNEVPYINTVIAIRKSFDHLHIKNDDLFNDENQRIKDINSFFTLINRLENFLEENKVEKKFNQIYLEEVINELIISFFKRNTENLGYKLYQELKKTNYLDNIKFKTKYKIYLFKLFIKSLYQYKG